MPKDRRSVSKTDSVVRHALQAELDQVAAAEALVLEEEFAAPQEETGKAAVLGVAETAEEISNDRSLRSRRSMVRGVGADQSQLMAITADQIRDPATMELGTQVSILISVLPRSERRQVRFEGSA